jgi:hypothetical protein
MYKMGAYFVKPPSAEVGGVQPLEVGYLTAKGYEIPGGVRVARLDNAVRLLRELVIIPEQEFEQTPQPSVGEADCQ